MTRKPLLDLNATWRQGPFCIDASIRGAAGPWLSARDIERRFNPFLLSPSASSSFEPVSTLTLRLTTDWDEWPRDGILRPSLELESADEEGHRWTVRRTDLWGELDRPARRVTAAMAPQGPVMEECLRLLIWLALSEPEGVDGLIVHCGCAVRGGQAWCFPAPRCGESTAQTRRSTRDRPASIESE
ncbi:MAG: hypothetical protein AAFX99_35160, partial [Myxococcota bacterium]